MSDEKSSRRLPHAEYLEVPFIISYKRGLVNRFVGQARALSSVGEYVEWRTRLIRVGMGSTYLQNVPQLHAVHECRGGDHADRVGEAEV